jgi:hypothetical protein
MPCQHSLNSVVTLHVIGIARHSNLRAIPEYRLVPRLGCRGNVPASNHLQCVLSSCSRRRSQRGLGEYKANMLGLHLLDRPVELVKEYRRFPQTSPLR